MAAPNRAGLNPDRAISKPAADPARIDPNRYNVKAQLTRWAPPNSFTALGNVVATSMLFAACNHMPRQRILILVRFPLFNKADQPSCWIDSSAIKLSQYHKSFDLIP